MTDTASPASRPSAAAVADEPGSQPASTRYEFRCWPTAPVNLPDMLQCAKVEERSDLYCIWPTDGDLLPKLRDANRLQIKRRLAAHGALESWAMLLDVPFPLGDADRMIAAEHLGCGLTAAHGRCVQAFIRALDRNGMEMVRVAKVRRQVVRDGVKIEHVLACGSGIAQASIALESTDREGLLLAMAALGVATLPNRSYHWWLSRQLLRTRVPG